MNPNPPITSQRGIRRRCHRAASARKAFPAAGLLLLGFLLGCAASDSELTKVDPGLSAADLRQGKVAVLGVVKFQEPDQVRPPLLAMLERTFRYERRDIPLISADSVRQSLGQERYRRLLLGYEYQGSLDAEAIREISDSLRGAARFILLARVEKDRTRNSARGISAADTGVIRSDYAMGITGRDALVAVHLYDLNRGVLVMTARYDGSSENAKPMISPMRSGGSSGMVVEVGRAVSPEEQGYPGAPELALALEEPFRTFARSLPGAPDSTAAPPPPARPR
jgi:hypothetical protein